MRLFPGSPISNTVTGGTQLTYCVCLCDARKVEDRGTAEDDRQRRLVDARSRLEDEARLELQIVEAGRRELPAVSRRRH